MVPLADGSVSENLGVDSDESATAPYWSGAGRPTLIVPAVRFRQRSGSSVHEVASQPRMGIDGLGTPDGVVHVIACGADGERVPRGIMDSYEALASDP